MDTDTDRQDKAVVMHGNRLNLATRVAWGMTGVVNSDLE